MANISFLEKLKIPTYDNPDQNLAGEVSIDYDKCTGCLLCIKLCPADALCAEDKRPVMKPPGQNECMGCGDCAAFCADRAIRLITPFRSSGYFKPLGQGDVLLPRL